MSDHSNSEAGGLEATHSYSRPWLIPLVFFQTGTPQVTGLSLAKSQWHSRLFFLNDLTDDLGHLRMSLGLFVKSGGSSDSQGLHFIHLLLSNFISKFLVPLCLYPTD